MTSRDAPPASVAKLIPEAKQRLRAVLEQCARAVAGNQQPPSSPAPPPDPAARARARKLARRRQLEQLGVGLTPRMLELLAAEQLPDSEPLVVVREWYCDPDPARRRVLVLCAGVGAGKTVAGAALALADPGSLWATPRALLQAHGTLYGDEGARWQRLAHAPLLIVDGLGGEETRHHAQVSLALRELLEARAARDTLVTTYVSRAQLARTYAHGALGSLLDELALQRAVASPNLRGAP